MPTPSKVLSVVSSMESKGDGVYLVSFELPARYTRFLPGQFLHLALDEFDPTTGYWPESRVFSIASEPMKSELTIVYSVKGQFTHRMEQELHVGRSVWLKLPYGSFVVAEELLEQGPVALIAGGTGVSPYWPFLKKNREKAGKVHLFYGVRHEDHLLFSEDLTRLLEMPWFNLHLTVEEGGAKTFPFLPGRLSIEGVAKELGTELAAAHFFLSGPPGMLNQFRKDLASLGVEPQRIHFDEWE